MVAQEPADFETFRRKIRERRRPEGEPEPPTREALREKLASLRPDMTPEGKEPDAKRARRDMGLRVRLLSVLGDAMLTRMGAAADGGVSLAFERLYRIAHEANPEEPTMVDPDTDPVGVTAVVDVGLLTAAALLIRMVRSSANPANDTEADRAFYGAAAEQRMDYFRNILPDLTGAILHLESVLNVQLPGAVTYLKRRDNEILAEVAAAHATTHAAEAAEDPSEPGEDPAAEVVAESIKAALSALLGVEVEVESVTRVDPSQIDQAPESGPKSREDGE